MLYESKKHGADGAVRFINGLYVRFENKGQFFKENDRMILYHKTNREALSVLCSVIKHSGSGESTQEVRRIKYKVVQPFESMPNSNFLIR